MAESDADPEASELDEPGAEVAPEAILEETPMRAQRPSPWETASEVEEALAAAAERVAAEQEAEARAQASYRRTPVEVRPDAILEETPVPAEVGPNEIVFAATLEDEPVEDARAREAAAERARAAPAEVSPDAILEETAATAVPGAAREAATEGPTEAATDVRPTLAVVAPPEAEPEPEPERGTEYAPEPERERELDPQPQPTLKPKRKAKLEPLTADADASPADAAPEKAPSELVIAYSASPPASAWHPPAAGYAAALRAPEPTLELMPEDLIAADVPVPGRAAARSAPGEPPPADHGQRTERPERDDALALARGVTGGFRALAPPLPAPASTALVSVPQTRALVPAAAGPAPAPEGLVPMAVHSATLVEEAMALALPFAAGSPMMGAIPRGGTMIAVRVDELAYARARLIVVSEGALSFEVLRRRRHGRPVDEVLGGEDPFCRVEGRGLLTIGALGQTLLLIDLLDQRLYLRESVVAAFDERLLWESGSLRMEGADAEPLLHLRGSGQVVLRTARPVVALPVRVGSITRTRAASVAGWMGNVVPTPAASPLETRTRTSLEFHGEGVVLCHDLAAALAGAS